MTTFKNVTDQDLEVMVDGSRVLAPAGESFDVPEEHADSLRSQPNFTEVAQVKATSSENKNEEGN